MNIRLPRIRLPRRTVRLKLTLLYGGLFLASGAALLALTFFLVVRATDGLLVYDADGKASWASYSAGEPTKGDGASTTTNLRAEGEHEPGGSNLPPPTAKELKKFEAAGIAKRDALRWGLVLVAAIGLGVMTLLSLGLGWLVAGRILRRVHGITAKAREISAANLGDRLALDGPDDELKEMGDTFDELLGRLDAAFEAQRRFVANASHELRTPLARQRAVAQVALADPEATTDELRAAHESVLVSGAEQERLIGALLTLARGQAGLDRRDEYDLADVTRRVLDEREPEFRDADLAVRQNLAPAKTSGDSRLAERLVSNLVDNAIRYNSEPGEVEVRTSNGHGAAVLVVSNTGQQVSEEELPRLMQPFQRMTPDRVHGRAANGHGLGLSIVQAIADAHGAAVEVRPHSSPHGGLEVAVHFPVRETMRVLPVRQK